ncbi:cupin domain-containing protein [Candidatus Viridilinea mediisalina]|uniref:Cupin n=1 Tax=Candidatus Viridilinea mediisalina TaxID=2024553 RepID=A0A2A6RLC7_9CHLR|nr:cupin domain-containing protein [Candidatus Viridilinea mediisalina]PDW03852.1 cupin [Candidatus Viridilinea mediisalina]
MIKGPSANWIEVFPGVRRRRLVATPAIYQMIVHLAAGSEIPSHQHPQEQISYVVSGRLRMQLDATVCEAGPGDAVAIPANSPHAVWTLEDAVVLDTFTPPRADYLAADGD